MTPRIKLIARVLLVLVLVPAITACSMLPFGGPTATPTAPPSDTPAPVTDTPVPEPTPNYLFFDSFTDPASGWPTVNTDTTKAGYHPPDAYHLEVSVPETFVWIYREQDFNDFSAVLQVYIENAAETGQWRHGLMFRRVGDEGFYVLAVNPRTQSWQVLKRGPAPAEAEDQAPIWTILHEGTNASISSELKAVNTLRVDAQGANLTFSVNGVGLIALTDADYAAGDFGFYLETFDTTLAHIHFDELAVLPYDPATVPVAPTQEVTGTPTPTETETPTPTLAPGQAQPTFNATAFVATSAALGTVIPPGATLACGVPGFPCPGTVQVPDVGTFIPPAVGSAIPDVVGSIVP